MGGIALIVDSDSDQALAFRMAARAEFLEPEVFHDGEAAITFIEERHMPRLLITALSPAGIDGFAILESLRRIADVEEVPALVSSGYPSLRHRAWRDRKDLGVSEIIERPASVEVCQAAIGRALGDPMVVGRPADQAPPVRVPRVPPASNIPGLEAIVARLRSSLGFETALILDTAGGMTVIGSARLEPLRAWPPTVEAMHAHGPLFAPTRRHPLLADDPLIGGLGIGGLAIVPVPGPAGNNHGALILATSGPLSMSLDTLDRVKAIAARIAGEVEQAIAAIEGRSR